MNESGEGKKSKIVDITSERLRREQEATYAAQLKQREALIEPFNTIGEMTSAFNTSIEELAASIMVSLKLVSKDSSRAQTLEEAGNQIVQALEQGRGILTDRHIKGNAYARGLYFHTNLEHIADLLSFIFNQKHEQGGSKLVNLNTYVAGLAASEEIKEALEVVLKHLSILDHFIENISDAYTKIVNVIDRGLGNMGFDEFEIDPVDAENLGAIGEKIHIASTALRDDSGIMSLQESLNHFERLLTEAKDQYLVYFQKYHNVLKS